MSDDHALLPIQVVVSGGNRLASAIDAAVEPWLSQSPLATAAEVVIAVPAVALARDPLGAPRRLVERFKHDRRSARIVVPSRTIAGSLLSVRQPTRWTSVPVSASAEWLDHASILSALATADPIIFVNALDSRRRWSSPVIGSWVRFAHPRQRLAAAATDQREGLTVEIASAFRPALILLIDAGNDPPLVITSNDQIAAELAALAVQDLHHLPNDDVQMVGPWEHPLIQRATELGLGVTWPGALHLRAIWTGEDDESARTQFLAFVEHIRTRLGISHSIQSASARP
jgi:hypothetical protein